MQVPPFSLEKQLSEIGHDLELAVSRVISSGQYVGGKEVQTFEESFAAWIGSTYSVGCNSGTDALILALRALDIGPGDEVITSSFSFFATAEAISSVGARPVFLEVDSNNYLMNLDFLESAITKSTKAIMPVHLFGCPVDMERLTNIAQKYGLKVIEDCAQALGASWNGTSIGVWGDIGCFSFFPTKNLGAAGDAGAITTNNSAIAKRVRELGIHGMPRRYFHTQLGYNSRLDAIQAAILNVKLPKVSGWISRRNHIFSKYKSLLEGITLLSLPDNSLGINSVHACNQFVVKVNDFVLNELQRKTETLSLDLGLPDSKCRDWLKYELEKNGVNTIIYYPIPIHLQPAYKEYGYKPGILPITEKLCSQVLSLPIFPEITNAQQQDVVNAITAALQLSN